MNTFFKKYKAIVLVVFLGIFISVIDRYIMGGHFQGVEEHKHFIYIAALLVGLVVMLSVLLKDDAS